MVIRQDKEDIFKRCADLLYSFSIDSKSLDLDSKVATEFYKFIEDNLLEFQMCPSKVSKSFRSRLHGCYSAKVMMIVMFLTKIPVIISSCNIFGGIFLGLCFILVNKFCDFTIRKIKTDSRDQINSSFMTELKKLVDYEYLDILSSKKDKKIEFGLVNIINKIIDRNVNRDDKRFVEKLLLLEIDYSIKRCEEIDGEREEIDKYSYIYELLDVELEMYSNNERVGLLIKKPEVSLDHLYDFLKYLGWDREIVLQDSYLRSVISSMKGLIENPYEGVEVDLIEMIKLAIRYVKEYNIDTSSAGVKDEILSDYICDLDLIFFNAVDKYNKAAILEENTRQIEEALCAQGRSQAIESPTKAKRLNFNNDYKVN